MTEALDPAQLEVDYQIDNRDGNCARGLARIKDAFSWLPDGAVLEVISTNRRAKTEFERLSKQTPHELIALDVERAWLIKKRYTAYFRVHHPQG